MSRPDTATHPASTIGTAPAIPVHLRHTNEADLDAVARMMSLAFGAPVDGCREWINPLREHNRVLAPESGPPVANVLTIPMGQYFGGKSVPMTGIAGVAVSPEHRGGGLAQQLMREVLTELHASGISLSTLYASTQSLYRKVGYEQAGLRANYKLDLRRLTPRRDHAGGHADPAASAVPVGSWRELTEGDHPAVVDCYRTFARRENGLLDRGEYIWGRVRVFRDKEQTGFGLWSADNTSLLAYVFLYQERGQYGHFNMSLQDLAFRDAPAGRELMKFLTSFSTTGTELTFAGGATHPLLMLAELQLAQQTSAEIWMTRIVHLQNALTARGYAAAATGQSLELALDVQDAVLPGNSGRWLLQVASTGAACTKLDAPSPKVPTLGCTIGGLVPVYSGWQTARQAAATGLVWGDDRALAMADAVFTSGGSSWCVDFF